MADSDINEKGIPIDVDASNIYQALVGLWDSLVLEGNHEPYSIPLLGTGKARAKDASREEVVREIILSFLAASKDHKITESITICIHPKDYEKVDWDRLCEFLRYESQYANIKPINARMEGIEEITPSIVKLSDIPIEDHDKEDIIENHEKNHIQETDLTDRERKLVSILRGNEMSRSDIAEAMGLSMNTTSRLLQKLLYGEVIRSKGDSRNRVFFVAENEAHRGSN